MDERAGMRRFFLLCAAVAAMMTAVASAAARADAVSGEATAAIKGTTDKIQIGRAHV
jgi:hypothetical protein